MGTDGGAKEGGVVRLPELLNAKIVHKVLLDEKVMFAVKTLTFHDELGPYIQIQPLVDDFFKSFLNSS